MELTHKAKTNIVKNDAMAKCMDFRRNDQFYESRINKGILLDIRDFCQGSSPMGRLGRR